LKRFVADWLPLLIACYLLGPGEWFGRSWLHARFVPSSPVVESVGLTLCIAGAFVACWSRFLLGRNWSLAVQVKEDHELIERGPYASIRHPIYTGLLAMFAGSAVMIGEWRTAVAFVIVAVSFWFKAKREEHLMLQQFGEQYAAYVQRTKALIPRLL